MIRSAMSEDTSVRCCCVDGTNVVRSGGYAGPAFREQEEADARRLVEALGRAATAIGPGVEIEVVFDGQWRPWSAPAGVRLRFARETPADELILDRVRSRSWAGAGRVTVVTGDTELGRRAMEEGGRWLRLRPGSSLEEIVGAVEDRFLR